MHNLLARANALLAFTLWVMAAVTAACFLSTVFLDYTTKAEIEVKDVQIRKINDFITADETVDLATLSFNLKSDFTKIFNWNVKQLYVYLLAEYQSANNVMNQVVVWDRIVERSERVLMSEHNVRGKYHFVDDGTGLINNPNVTFVLRYNVVPNSGYLRLSQASGQVIVPFPTTYTTKRR